MALRAVVVRDGHVVRHDVSGLALELHIVRTEGGDVMIRVYDRGGHYGDSGAISEVTTAPLAQGPALLLRSWLRSSLTLLCL